MNNCCFIQRFRLQLIQKRYQVPLNSVTAWLAWVSVNMRKRKSLQDRESVGESSAEVSVFHVKALCLRSWHCKIRFTTVTSTFSLSSVTLLLLKCALYALSLLSFNGRTLFCLTHGTAQPLHFHPRHCCCYCAKKRRQVKKVLHPTIISTFKQREVLTNSTWWLPNDKGMRQNLTTPKQRSSQWPEKLTIFSTLTGNSRQYCII